MRQASKWRLTTTTHLRACSYTILLKEQGGLVVECWQWFRGVAGSNPARAQKIFYKLPTVHWQVWQHSIHTDERLVGYPEKKNCISQSSANVSTTNTDWRLCSYALPSFYLSSSWLIAVPDDAVSDTWKACLLAKWCNFNQPFPKGGCQHFNLTRGAFLFSRKTARLAQFFSPWHWRHFGSLEVLLPAKISRIFSK